jgi:hypothetical protein
MWQNGNIDMLLNLEDKLKVISFLSNNREYLEAKIRGLKYLKESSLSTIPDIFHEDVLDQYESHVRTMILKEISEHTKVDGETILIALEGFDLKGFLNG